jgi:hypothetical protein
MLLRISSDAYVQVLLQVWVPARAAAVQLGGVQSQTCPAPDSLAGSPIAMSC